MVYGLPSIRSLVLFALVSINCACTAVRPPISPPEPTLLDRLAEYKQKFSLPDSQAPLPPPNFEVNHHVLFELKDFLRHDAKYVRDSFQRRREVETVVREIFIDQGIPLELINLALVESGYLLDARSPAGAVGMWQFMPSTARLYDLEVSLSQDERTDLVLSSLAACRFLRKLFEEYGDWNLVLAAYNSGPGAVNRAVRKAGSTSFWVIARKGGLPLETKRFVPRFIAANLIHEHVEKFGLDQLDQIVADKALPVTHGWPANKKVRTGTLVSKKTKKGSSYGLKNRKRS